MLYFFLYFSDMCILCTSYRCYKTVNVAINCAGIATARKTLSQKENEDGTTTKRLHSLEEFTKTITVNTIGSFNVSRLASERMASRSEDDNGLRGCIINTASVSAFDGQVG